MVVFFAILLVAMHSHISTSGGCFMNIYVYSDESGVFDKIHNKYWLYVKYWGDLLI